MTKLISKKPIFDSGYFTVYEDEVEIKTGEKRKYYSAIRIPAVSVFPLGDNGEIYLIKEYRYLHEGYILEAVAGTMDKGEAPLQTAKRELLEEAGIKASKWHDLGKSIAAGSFITWTQHLFVARSLSFTKQMLEESEDISVVKMKFEDALEKVISGEINNSSTSFGILLIDHLIKRGKI